MVQLTRNHIFPAAGYRTIWRGQPCEGGKAGHGWETTKKRPQMVESWWSALCRIAIFDGVSEGDLVRLSLQVGHRHTCAGAHQETSRKGTNLVVSPLPQRILRTQRPRETCCAHLGVATHAWDTTKEHPDWDDLWWSISRGGGSRQGCWRTTWR